MKISHPRSLRRFIVVWSGAIGVAFLLLALVAGFTLSRLDFAASDAAGHTERLQRMQEFETTALEASHLDKASWRRSDAALLEVQRISNATELAPIETAYRALKAAPTAREEERAFLDALRDYRRAEFAHVTIESQQSARVNQGSRGAIFVLLALALIGLVAGGIEMWTRVFGPLLTISRAAQRFGAGELTARVPIERADEIGDLGATWNGMAAAIETREAERLRFVAAVAHDLKSPLMVVGMAAVMLRDKPDKFSPTEVAEWLGIIASNARRMEAMIADLTNAVQAQTGALQLQYARFDMAAVARECAAETALVFADHALIYEGESALEVDGDRARVERVVANLLSNAAKYSAKATDVTIALERRGDNAVLEIRDQGVGIAPADLKRLFAPFVRLERTEKMANGTGLGLATTKKIVEAHGGQLEVESEVGVGSTFRVVLSLQRDASQIPLRLNDKQLGFSKPTRVAAGVSR